MDAPAGRLPDPIDVRLDDPGQIAAALPQLLGFRPRESVVLVSLTGPRGGRVGLTVRADIPPVGHAAAVAGIITRSVCTDRPARVLVAVVSEAGDEIGPVTGGVPGIPHRGLVGEVVRALAAVGVAVADALLVRDGRWWSYDCPRSCCDADAGTALPGGVTELEVAAVATGMVVERDRDDLAARIGRPRNGTARSAMAAACARIAAECSAEILESGWDAVAARSWTAVAEGLARCRPGPGAPLSDLEVARIVWGLRDTVVRDRALELALGSDAPAAEQLWTECTRRAPAPLDVAPATLLAVSAWLRGDGAMANVALSRALAGEPGYVLAGLLAEALARCLPPAALRGLISATLEDDGHAFPAG
jgi:hypothetical protein